MIEVIPLTKTQKKQLTQIYSISKEEFFKKIEILKQNSDLKEIVNLLLNTNGLSKRESKILDKISFKTLSELISTGLISNKMNREEELDVVKSYKIKLHHLIRYVDGISRKSHLQLSLIPTKGATLYISDDGTMASLAFGKYYLKKTITAQDWKVILNSIHSDYDLDGTEVFYNKIYDWIDGLSEQQEIQKYSLADVIKNTNSMEYYGETTLPYEINKYTVTQHIKDQQNANLQPNPWIAHNFYKAPAKAEDLYDTEFCGDALLEEHFSKVIGIGTEPNTQADRLFRNYARNSKKALFDVPFYTTKGALMKVEQFADIIIFNQYFANYAKNENNIYGKWWYDTYIKLVTEVSSQSMIDHISLIEIIKEEGWDSIRLHLKTIKDKLGITSSVGSWDDLTPFKDDFAMYISFVILALHKLYPTSLSRAENTNIKRIKDKLINEIKNNLTTDLLKTFKENDGYRNWEARFDNVWTPAIKEVHNQLTGKKKSESVFDKEVNHQKDFVKRIISNNGWGSVYYAYCHTNNELVKIDFNDTKKTFHGLHCVPRDFGGTAEDGVIWGLVGDNEGTWKYKNLNEEFNTPADYWYSLSTRNREMLDINSDSLSPLQITSLKKFIELCEQIAINELNYLKKI